MTDKVNPKLKYSPEIIKINDKMSIEVSEYYYRLNEYYEIVLKSDKYSFFLGRFYKIYDNIFVDYKDGKILISFKEFSAESNKMEIIKILSLYEIIDDLYYSCKEIDALELFDSEIDKKYLKNPNNYIYREDIVKKNKVKKLGAF